MTLDTETEGRCLAGAIRDHTVVQPGVVHLCRCVCVWGGGGGGGGEGVCMHVCNVYACVCVCVCTCMCVMCVCVCVKQCLNLEGDGLKSSKRASNPEVQFHAGVHRVSLVPVGSGESMEGVQDGLLSDGGEPSPVDGLEGAWREMEGERTGSRGWGGGGGGGGGGEGRLGGRGGRGEERGEGRGERGGEGGGGRERGGEGRG